MSVIADTVLDVGERQRIPEGLAEMAPGPELACLLAQIDTSRLSGYDRVEVLRARYRQLNHDTAALMTAMVDIGLCGEAPEDVVPPRLEYPHEFSADELRVALSWSRRSADRRFGLAYDLLTRLPAVHTALGEGTIDEPKASALSEWTVDLTEEQARAICDRLLPAASTLTCGQLVEKIKKLAIAIDDEGGWQLTQPEPGRFVWTSPLTGHRYPVHPPPIIEPLPDPIPRQKPAKPEWLTPDDGWHDSTIGPDPPPPPPEPPEPDPTAHIPPF